MSEPIIWAALSAKEKTRRIVQDVMGWTYFPVWNTNHAAIVELERHVTFPYTFCSGDFIFVVRQSIEDVRRFNPLEDWNEAWAIFLHIMEQYSPTHREWFTQDNPSFRAFVETLLGDFDCAYNDEIYPGQAIFPEIAKWTPELICLAALRAVGVDVKVSEP